MNDSILTEKGRGVKWCWLRRGGKEYAGRGKCGIIEKADKKYHVMGNTVTEEMGV